MILAILLLVLLQMRRGFPKNLVDLRIGVQFVKHPKYNHKGKTLSSMDREHVEN